MLVRNKKKKKCCQRRFMKLFEKKQQKKLMPKLLGKINAIGIVGARFFFKASQLNLYFYTLKFMSITTYLLLAHANCICGKHLKYHKSFNNFCQIPKIFTIISNFPQHQNSP